MLAWVTYRLIEWPIRFGTRARVAVPALGVVMTAVCAAGVAIYSSGGVIERPINRSDAAHLVDYYERMRKTGIAEALPSRVRLHGLGRPSTRATRSIRRASGRRRDRTGPAVG